MTVRDAFDSVGEKKSRAIYDSAPQGHRNYDLAGPESRAAIRKGLASGHHGHFGPRPVTRGAGTCRPCNRP